MPDLIRATALLNYPSLVTELGGNPTALLRAARIRPADVGCHDTYLTYRGMIQAMESAAAATGAQDFGRRLAQRQGIGILGPVGVAARTAPTAGHALATFETYLAAYSPAIATRVIPLDEPLRVRFEFHILLAPPLPPHTQIIELSLGVMLRVLRLLLGPTYVPALVHIPHEPLTPGLDYRRYFGATCRFADRVAGFTLNSADLAHPLAQDEATHMALRDYLATIITDDGHGITQPVQQLVAQLLSTGAATRDVIARQLGLHPRTLQRRLADEATTYAELVDQVRRNQAERLLRDTNVTLGHLARELGYAEQSVLTRSCLRWFGTGPKAHRRALRADRTR